MTTALTLLATGLIGGIIGGAVTFALIVRWIEDDDFDPLGIEGRK